MIHASPCATSCQRRFLVKVKSGYTVCKSKADAFSSNRDLYSGLIGLHVLHHAIERPVFGLGIVEELVKHGYRISPGTLYPLLHGAGFPLAITIKMGGWIRM
jgi:hypothetical protein